jgi:hypothetical protein
MKISVLSLMTLGLTLAFSFGPLSVGYGNANTESITAYYRGNIKSTINVVVLYCEDEDLLNVYNLIGDFEFDLAWRQKVQENNLHAASSSVDSLGTETKADSSSLMVYIIYKDGSNSKHFLNKANAQTAFENIDIDDGKSPIHNMVKALP